MAKLTKGILGGISGKVGQVVGSHYQGRSVIQSLPKRKLKVPRFELPNNGSNLLSLASYMSVIKPHLIKVLADFSPLYVFDWNKVVKQIFIKPNLDIKAGIRPMSFGSEFKPSKFRYQNEPFPYFHGCVLNLSNLLSLTAGVAGLSIRWRVYSSRIGYDFWRSSFAYVNNIQLNSGFVPFIKGDTLVLVAYIHSSSEGVYSPLGVSVNHYF